MGILTAQVAESGDYEVQSQLSYIVRSYLRKNNITERMCVKREQEGEGEREGPLEEFLDKLYIQLYHSDMFTRVGDSNLMPLPMSHSQSDSACSTVQVCSAPGAAQSQTVCYQNLSGHYTGPSRNGKD